mmetsp:Transcript_25383/g.48462  ORF Transcript_25383/g.48462 Transcript_25383/m.48462 type:complete len:293 (+) Transcript_25383:106-984(+)
MNNSNNQSETVVRTTMMSPLFLSTIDDADRIDHNENNTPLAVDTTSHNDYNHTKFSTTNDDRNNTENGHSNCNSSACVHKRKLPMTTTTTRQITPTNHLGRHSSLLIILLIGLIGCSATTSSSSSTSNNFLHTTKSHPKTSARTARALQSSSTLPCEERTNKGLCENNAQGNIDINCLWGWDKCIDVSPEGVEAIFANETGLVDQPSTAPVATPSISTPAPSVAEPAVETYAPSEELGEELEPITVEPTVKSTARPTERVTAEPSGKPADEPSGRPFASPTEMPTDQVRFAF